MRLEIMDKEQEFFKEYEAFCSYNCFKHILNDYGVENPFMYFDSSVLLEIQEEDKEIEPVGYKYLVDVGMILPPYKHLLADIAPLGKSAEEVWEENKKDLDKGYPLVTSVDIFELKYNEYYQKFHSNHCVVLAGYTENTAEIIDCYEWNFKGAVSLEEFLKARSSLCSKDDSIYSGWPINNAWMRLEREGWDGNIKDLLKSTLEQLQSTFYECDKSEEDTSWKGFDAVNKMLELLMLNKTADENQQRLILELARKVVLCVYKGLNFLHYYLEETVKILPLDEVKAFADIVGQDKENWHSLLNSIIKSSFCLSERVYKKIVQKYNQQILREEARYEEIKHLIEIL